MSNNLNFLLLLFNLHIIVFLIPEYVNETKRTRVVIKSHKKYKSIKEVVGERERERERERACEEGGDLFDNFISSSSSSSSSVL